jgi:hypothetical protein
VKVYNVGKASSPKVSKSDIFPTTLVRVNDDVFGSVDLSKRFADEEARNPVGASDLDTNLRSCAPDNFLNKIPLFLGDGPEKGRVIPSSVATDLSKRIDRSTSFMLSRQSVCAHVGAHDASSH